MSRLKGKVSQEILKQMLTGGALVLAEESISRFWSQLLTRFFGERLADRSFSPRAVKDAFYYLKRSGLIAGKLQNGQLYVFLTAKGEAEANKLRLNDLEIRRPRLWDGKWRLVIFEIPNNRAKRQALANRLKSLGFHYLQRGVWLLPFPCAREVRALREFFSLGQNDLRLFEAENLEDDKFFREHFRLPD